MSYTNLCIAVNNVGKASKKVCEHYETSFIDLCATNVEGIGDINSIASDLPLPYLTQHTFRVPHYSKIRF